MYDHFVAVDWAKSNMAIARLSKLSSRADVRDVPSDLSNLKAYLASLKGRKILAFEETTTAQWLYVELRELVDAVVICDPFRNKLLSEGPKNDKIDARKLAELLRAGLLKPVFHSCDELIDLRKIVSGYEDMIQRGVRLKNQRSALLRAFGKGNHEALDKTQGSAVFVMQGLDSAIETYEDERKRYDTEFRRLIKQTKMLHWLSQIPGIGPVGAVKLGAAVVDGARFPHRNHFLSLCGLIRLEKMSGGRSYGSRAPRFRRDLKAVMKTAALVAVTHENCFTPYYRYLIEEKRYPDHQARHAVARKIATAVYGVMKSKRHFNPKELGALRALSKT